MEEMSGKFTGQQEINLAAEKRWEYDKRSKIERIAEYRELSKEKAIEYKTRATRIDLCISWKGIKI